VAFGESKSTTQTCVYSDQQRGAQRATPGSPPVQLAELIEVRGIGVLTCARHGEALLQALRDIEERDGYWRRFTGTYC
jgi:hypothetical protein